MKILLVCSGNICRSPTAEGLLTKLCADAGLDCTFDSAGMHGMHAGEAPDTRAIKMAKSHGIDISKQRARQIRDSDFDEFDIIYAMDSGHMQGLKAKRPTGAHAKLKMFDENMDVPDPWYGDMSHFEETYSIIESAAQKIVQDLKDKAHD